MIINLQKQPNKYPKEVMLKQNYTPLFKNANAQIGLFLEAGEILESGKLENGMYRIEFFALPCFLEVTEKEYKKYFRELDPIQITEKYRILSKHGRFSGYTDRQKYLDSRF